MTTYSIALKEFDINNQNVGYLVKLNDNNFTFNCRWNSYADCGFLSIEDEDSNKIISSIALVNGLRIRHNKLPYVLYFKHNNNETYEPTIENISKEFSFFYEVE